MQKPWYASKALWFNVLALVVAVASGFGFAEFEVAPETMAIAGAVIAVINVVIRTWFTDTKLTS